MAAPDDRVVLAKTVSLMEFLAEVTDATERDPVRDILADETGKPDPLVWLDEVPDGVRLTPHPQDDVLLRIRPPRTTPEPKPPVQVAGWIDSVEPRGIGGTPPALRDHGPEGVQPDQMVPPPDGVRHAFDRWVAEWHRWGDEQARTRKSRQLYESLERAAKTMEQQDDEYEFVVAVGLLCWQTPDGEQIRRHLVSEPVLPKLERDTAEITVSFLGGKRRFEDREILGDQDGYQPDRGRAARQAVLDSEIAVLDERLLAQIEQWLGLGLTDPFTSAVRRPEPSANLPTAPELTTSPALLLRPRSRMLLAETYRRIADELRQPDAEVPVALAQLVMDTEVGLRNRWLTEQDAVSGDVLGSDPLFPLPTNDEQQRVIELLKTEIGVVVQGPPGTGKTHTIANLVSALLARGLRVLVTSQKDQALKVLRDKIPPELRSLCVLLAGGSKDAAKELEKGLDALSEAISSPSAADLPRQARELAAERHTLRSRGAVLNDRIRQLRDVEYRTHEPVVPGYNDQVYQGTLTDIVREVKRNADDYGWIPPVDPHCPDRPPLSMHDLLELLRLTRSDLPTRRVRAEQEIPGRDDLPSASDLAEIINSERQAQHTAHADTSDLTQRLASLGAQRLHELRGLGDTARAELRRLGFGEDYIAPPERAWVARAVGDRLAERHAGLWGHLFEVRAEARRLQDRIQAQGLKFAVELPAVHDYGIGKTRGLLNAGMELRAYLASGKKLHKMLPKSPAQKNAAELLDVIRVDGQPPLDLTRLDAALERLEAEVAAAQLVEMWASAAVEVTTAKLTLTLSELDDNSRLLGNIDLLARTHAEVNEHLRRAGLPIDLSTVAAFVRLLNAVPAALHYVELERARTQVAALQSKVATLAGSPNSCSELGILLQAVGERDLEAYRKGIDAVDIARRDRTDELRRAQLARTLRAVHPQLFELIERTAADPAWDARLGDLPAAWAWSKAEQYMLTTRNADEERRLGVEFDQVEDEVKRVTERLAGVQALQACLARMTDTHAMALRSYREHMSHVGAGGGSKTREYRKAARAAMHKAKGAVPAWVVPLPNLLDNIAAVRDSFDVVIVDEASQVGLEQLFLLWMAPRVIVVGDDKQCTPGANRLGQIEPLFAKLQEHLGDMEEEIRMNFTAKSNLYGLLSARSGKDAVVRLREHFRCMPEIINWSSSQFYGEESRPGLVPLRERKATDLEPLKVVHVDGAYTEGNGTSRRNPTEAKRIVDQLATCLADPRYNGKTFGVVVLQGTGQLKLLEHEINAAISVEDREKRRIRVGIPPTFQGDERDVIFLSMVVAEPPRAQRAQLAQQGYNVAASRARDQMWLFSSVRLTDLKPDDLRASLMGYMLRPPSVFGQSPSLDDVSENKPCEPFESLFEQRVFREIKSRGYHIVPQYKVGTRRLDLVIVGRGGRLAVECDGHRWHTSTTQQVSDARRDRELNRMGWDVVRIRESEFEFSVGRELAPLWARLEEREIYSGDVVEGVVRDWAPVELPDSDTEIDDIVGAEA
jgi:very-short-patch-repair endonuclease